MRLAFFIIAHTLSLANKIIQNSNMAITPQTEEHSATNSNTVEQKSNNKQFKMVALDLDGTLLNSKHQISDTSVQYLRYLHDKGLIVCIATGRSAYATADVIQKLDLKYPNNHTDGFPLVCFNGARGLSVVKGNVIANTGTNTENPMIDGRLQVTELFHNHVPIDLTLKTLVFAKSIGCITNYYIDHDIYAHPFTDWHNEATKKYTDLTGVKYTFCNDEYKAAIERGLPSKLLLLCQESEIDSVYQKTAEHLKDEAMVIKGSPPFFVEILRHDVCKGNGLETLASRIGVGLDECITFGDGNNDLEFIQKSGLGYAMKNAVDTLKSVADDVTEYSNNDDGVILTLKKLEQNGQLLLQE